MDPTIDRKEAAAKYRDLELEAAFNELNQKPTYEQPGRTSVLIVIDQGSKTAEIYKAGTADVLVKVVTRLTSQSEEQFERSIGWLWNNETYLPANWRKTIPLDESQPLREIAAQLEEVQKRWGILNVESVETLLQVRRALGRGTLAEIVECLLSANEEAKASQGEVDYMI